MKQTFRTWVWEWGVVILIVGVLVTNFGWAMWISNVFPLYTPGLIGAPFIPILIYWTYLIRRYPTRKDLPEWQEYIGRRDAQV